MSVSVSAHEQVRVPQPAGHRNGTVRCGCGASWFGKNAMDSYRRHWLIKHGPPQQQEEE